MKLLIFFVCKAIMKRCNVIQSEDINMKVVKSVNRILSIHFCYLFNNNKILSKFFLFVLFIVLKSAQE